MQRDDVCDVRCKSPETQTRRGERARGRPPRMTYQGSDSPRVVVYRRFESYARVVVMETRHDPCGTGASSARAKNNETDYP